MDKNGRVFNLGFSEITRFPKNFDVEENKYACGEVEYQLQEYFAGERQAFTVEARVDGTEFQKSVWSRLSRIGFGETESYGEVARRIGRRGAARAVGNAVAANPVALLIPCHRVVPAGGGIGDYALRGLEKAEGRRIKRYLLDLESSQRNLEV